MRLRRGKSLKETHTIVVPNNVLGYFILVSLCPIMVANNFLRVGDTGSRNQKLNLFVVRLIMGSAWPIY